MIRIIFIIIFIYLFYKLVSLVFRLISGAGELNRQTRRSSRPDDQAGRQDSSKTIELSKDQYKVN